MKIFAKNNAGSFLRNKESHLEMTMHRRKENKPRTSPPPNLHPSCADWHSIVQNVKKAV